MTKILLKSAKRKTKLRREDVKKAIAAVFGNSRKSKPVKCNEKAFLQ